MCGSRRLSSTVSTIRFGEPTLDAQALPAVASAFAILHERVLAPAIPAPSHEPCRSPRFNFQQQMGQPPQQPTGGVIEASWMADQTLSLAAPHPQRLFCRVGCPRNARRLRRPGNSGPSHQCQSSCPANRLGYSRRARRLSRLRRGSPLSVFQRAFVVAEQSEVSRGPRG